MISFSGTRKPIVCLNAVISGGIILGSFFFNIKVSCPGQYSFTSLFAISLNSAIFEASSISDTSNKNPFSLSLNLIS